MNTPSSDAPANTADREARIRDLLSRLQPHARQVLRRMAERLVDLPEEQAFGQVEYDLRDWAHELAAVSHQAALEGGKKRGTSAPVPSAPSAVATPAARAGGTKASSACSGRCACSATTTIAAAAAAASAPSMLSSA